MTTPYNTGRMKLGSKYQPSQYPAYTSRDHDRVQQALLDYRNKSANDSILGSSRDLHRVRVGKRSMLWRLSLVLRDMWRWLKSPRAF
jgi:hypothetical protein